MKLLHLLIILFDITFANEIVVPVKPPVAYTKSVFATSLRASGILKTFRFHS